ncbi:PQQ-binding-like beta-propeller repeat protein, partial [Actinomadura miaoliensis]|uniref:outer membrane protein assembly factor BamB family protein n=1 Tax=Actinomadura miaoliensis TaxID=430685 RepID=UPI0031EDD173
MIAKSRIALVVLVMVGAAACGGGDDKTPRAESRKTEVPYNGPVLPGVEGKPVWSAPSPGASVLLGYGNAVAMLSAHQGYQVTVLDAATGKTLQRHQLDVVEQPTLLSGEPVRLLRDIVQGRPVAVVRFIERVPASGTWGEHEQLTDLVLDTTGRRLWRTPPNGGGDRITHRDRGTFDGGYAISHTKGQGTPDREPKGTTRFQPISGGGPVDVPSSYDNDDLYDVVGDKAVMREDKVLDDGVRAVDLAQGGKVVWRVPKAVHVATAGTNVLLRTTSGRLRQIDVATGQRRTDVPLSEVSGDQYGFGVDQVRTWAFDPQTRALIGSGQRTVIIDGDTGRVRWRQDGPNPRPMTPVASAAGVTFMALEQQQGSGQAQPGPGGFLALDNRTGRVVADN